MNIIIRDTSYIREIQEEFQKEFPYLKIEVFKKPIDENDPTTKTPVSGKISISNIRSTHIDGMINIDGSRSVEELESDFLNTFGLLAKVYRKSSSLWIETTLTEHWSLTRQNLAGLQMS